jgi:hypothetical protein
MPFLHDTKASLHTAAKKIKVTVRSYQNILLASLLQRKSVNQHREGTPTTVLGSAIETASLPQVWSEPVLGDELEALEIL